LAVCTFDDALLVVKFSQPMTETEAMPTDAETTDVERNNEMIGAEPNAEEEVSPESISEEQEVFLKHIQKKGLKRTSQRELILSVFLRTEDHLSNEDLYRLVKLEDPTVGQTTVYRTLKLLTEAGLAREVRFGDGRAHYEHNYKHQHHDHMICSECGKIIEFYSAELEAIQDAMAAKHNFEVTQHLLRIIGICDECRQQEKLDTEAPQKLRQAR
jgi:Fur family ferric uptake transcriptional regulator